jgi:hypothetical protein
MRAAYGSALRGFFAKKNPLQLIDFCGFKVFETATVDTNILVINNCENKRQLQACSFKNDYKRGDELGDYIIVDFIQDKATYFDYTVSTQKDQQGNVVGNTARNKTISKEEWEKQE